MSLFRKRELLHPIVVHPDVPGAEAIPCLISLLVRPARQLSVYIASLLPKSALNCPLPNLLLKLFASGQSNGVT